MQLGVYVCHCIRFVRIYIPHRFKTTGKINYLCSTERVKVLELHKADNFGDFHSSFLFVSDSELEFSLQSYSFLLFSEIVNMDYLSCIFCLSCLESQIKFCFKNYAEIFTLEVQSLKRVLGISLHNESSNGRNSMSLT